MTLGAQSLSTYLFWLNSGSLEEKCMACRALHEDNAVLKEVIFGLRTCLLELLKNQQVDDLYWRKSIEFGIRSFAIQLARVEISNLENDLVMDFQGIIRKVISVENEDVLAAGITALYEDAPKLGFEMIAEIEASLDEHRLKPNFRLAFLFERCLEKLRQQSPE